jgi:hypothetical protein
MLEAFDQSSLEGSNLTGAINALLQDIQTNVVDVILAESADTQAAIDTAFSKADSAVKTASSTWTAATAKWTTISSCIEGEKSLSAKYHQEAANVEAKKRTEETKKSAMEKEAEVSAILPSMTFDCDAAEGGACSQKWSAFSQSVKAKMELLEASYQAQVKQYEAAEKEYDAAKESRSEAEAARDSTNTAHYTQYMKCNGLEALAKEHFCDAAAAAEISACNEISSFQEVISKAQGKNNALSHDDRASEYNTTMQTMCLLRKVIDESVECSQTYDITGAPGFVALDYKEKDAESLACREKHKRTLSQYTWTRPERTEVGPPAAESTYEKTASQAKDIDQMKQEWCGEACSLSTKVESLTNAAAMKDNGWTFHDFCCQDQLGGQQQCSSGSFRQWDHWARVSTVRKYLQVGTCTGRAGRATLDFGNCWNSGKVNVYLNDVKIAVAPPATASQKHTFTFQNNDKLELKDEEGNAVIQINELTLETWEEK